MFEKLKNLIKNNKGFLIKTTILLGMYFFLSDFAFAQNAGSTGSTNIGATLDADAKKTVTTVLTWISTTISVFLGLLTYLVTLFLSPEWITGNIFNIGEKLKAIWILISNVVYFAFAFILIYIAFMNIVGAGGNDYEFKSALPKFIVGILIVPFSWFLVNFLVTLSSILTIAALNLPFDTFKNYETGISKVDIPKKCTIDLTALSSEGKTKEGQTQTNSIFNCDNTEGTVKLSVILGTDSAANNIFGMISLYTYGLVDLNKLTEIGDKTFQENIKTIGDVVVKVVFDIIFVIAYALLMIALGLALMIRGIWLWIYMMLSPLFGLMYFFGKGKDGFFENFNFTEFIHLCLVPVYTMLALSFGMLFIYTTGEGIVKSDGSTNSTILVEKDNNIVIGEGDKKFTLEIKGAISSNTNTSSTEIKNIFDTIGNGALGMIGSLILKIFGIVVLWGTVMMALSKSKITEAMVKPIAEFGNGVGSLVKNIPQYTPILPGGQSLQSLQQVPRSIDSFYAGQQSERSSNLVKSLGFDTALKDSVDKIIAANRKNDQEGKYEALKAIEDAIRNDKNIVNNKEFIEAANLALGKAGITEREFRFGNGKTADNYAKFMGGYAGKNTNDIFKDGKLSYAGKDENGMREILGLSATGAGEKVSDKPNGETGSNITINLANKSINLGNDKTINFSDNAKDVNTISSEIKTGLGNSTISKIDLKNALDNVGIKDNETINSIIAQLGDKVTE